MSGRGFPMPDLLAVKPVEDVESVVRSLLQLGAAREDIELIPVGIFLTYKAMHDSQLFSKEFYNRVFKRFRLFLSKFRKEKVLQTPK